MHRAIIKSMGKAKQFGQYFTPEPVARTLVRWAVKNRNDRILDPSCGDGEFLACHPYSVGIELDADHTMVARFRSGASLVHQSDFFCWAEQTRERFEAVVGNPPFIRYQGFAGEIRDRALRLSLQAGARFSQLSSSWAPFIAVSSGLLRPGGRLAFVVPAEIGHVTYALPLLNLLGNRFERVHITAIKNKIFRHLSEDAWLLFANGYGGSTRSIEFAAMESFEEWEQPPEPTCRVPFKILQQDGGRLRKWLLSGPVKSFYDNLKESGQVISLDQVAEAGIGYVSGGNEFFHLRPSQAESLDIPDGLLRVSVRRGEYLPQSEKLTRTHVREWMKNDEPVLLLHLSGGQEFPESVRKYLDTKEGQVTRQHYKCRVRDPWYAVPGVIVPDGFIAYMSGDTCALVQNSAACVATNSVHTVRLKRRISFSSVQKAWYSSFSALSREVEGHSLGGGMLKLEPGEVQRVLLPDSNLKFSREEMTLIAEGISAMKSWRHCG